jgi:hypothetical protein
MAKFELIKETLESGNAIYYTVLDGKYINNTYSINYEKAKEKYIEVIQPSIRKIEVLETTEVDLNNL